jgi:hypothetical protein
MNCPIAFYVYPDVRYTGTLLKAAKRTVRKKGVHDPVIDWGNANEMARKYDKLIPQINPPHHFIAIAGASDAR